jgi:hypothetical protein
MLILLLNPPQSPFTKGGSWKRMFYKRGRMEEEFEKGEE